jgi:hypothetical protein
MARQRYNETDSDRLSVLETQHSYVQKVVDELVLLTKDVPRLTKAVDDLTRYARIGLTLAAGALLHYAGTPLAKELGSLIASSVGIPQ